MDGESGEACVEDKMGGEGDEKMAPAGHAAAQAAA